MRPAGEEITIAVGQAFLLVFVRTPADQVRECPRVFLKEPRHVEVFRRRSFLAAPAKAFLSFRPTKFPRLPRKPRLHFVGSANALLTSPCVTGLQRALPGDARAAMTITQGTPPPSSGAWS